MVEYLPVRNLAANRVHAVRDDTPSHAAIFLGKPYTAVVGEPALCGVTMRDAVVLDEGAETTCPTCATLISYGVK